MIKNIAALFFLFFFVVVVAVSLSLESLLYWLSFLICFKQIVDLLFGFFCLFVFYTLPAATPVSCITICVSNLAQSFFFFLGVQYPFSPHDSLVHGVCKCRAFIWIYMY